MSTFKLELVTPEKLVFSEAADLVTVPGMDGDFGVMPGHSPLISTLRPGLMEIERSGGGEQKIFVAGGFAEVTPDRCTILAEEAHPLAELKLENAKQRLEAAKRALANATVDGERRRAEQEIFVAETIIELLSK